MGLGNTNQGFSGGGGAGGTSCIDSIGLTMPSAFNVCNSPLTCSGTINVCGAGLVSQYIRGDGTLADFPSTGGGSSVNYYLNGSVNQGTFGGDVYYQMSKTALTGASANFTRTNAQGNGYIASFITDAGDPYLLNIPSGNWNLEFYFNSSSTGGNPSFYGELYKVSASNVFTLISSNAISPEIITGGTSVDQYFTSIAVPQTTLLQTDRLAIRIYVTTSGRNITLHTQDNTLSEVLTTFTTGITALNGLTEQVQFFSVGTCGTDFNIDSCCGTHTFNLPTASCSASGALSAADYCSFSQKVMIADTGCCSTVRCGVCNCASGCYSFAGGGYNNTSLGCHSFAGGGISNCACGNSSFVGGGYENLAKNNISFIGGGFCNCTCGDISFIGGGGCNSALSTYSFVGGGLCNTVSGCYSFAGGGYNNTSLGCHSFIGGGISNCACGNSSFVGGGYENLAKNNISFIGGGFCNCTCGDISFVGGGGCNSALSTYSFIGGGLCNCASAAYSFSGGGLRNSAVGGYSFAGGGGGNCAAGAYSFVGGGGCNCALGASTFIGGGYCNCALELSSLVVGGYCNRAVGNYSFISGGYYNYVCGVYSFAGGLFNTVSGAYSGAVGCCLNACVAATFYVNNLCTCGSLYSSALTSGCAVCTSTNGQLVGYTPTVPTAAIMVLGTGCCSTVRCGVGNCASCTFSFAGGGCCNTASGVSSFVGSGFNNQSTNLGSIVVGGDNNISSNQVSFIGNGQCNIACGDVSLISNGLLNVATTSYSTVINGRENVSCAAYSIVSNGKLNTASSNYSITLNGCNNKSCQFASTVINGLNNTASGSYSIVSGYNNCALNNYSTVLNGFNNISNGCHATVINGLCNTVSGAFSSASGCCLNACNACTFYSNNFCACGSVYSSALSCNCAVCVSANGQLVGYTPNSAIMVLGSGCCSTVRCGVGNCASGCYSFAGGGYGNCASGEYSFVGVGSGNCASGFYSFVGGGGGNCASGLASFLGGGQINCALGSFSFAGGGTCNGALGCYSFVGGGNSNCACGLGSFVGGGVCNTVSASFSGAVGCCLNACNASTFYANNFCACGSFYSSALSCNCAVCISANGQLVGYTPSGGITGSGTCNFVPKFTGSTSIGNSLVYDNGTTVGINTTTPSASYKLDVNGTANFYTSTVGATVLTVQGSTGQLFTVSDIITGNLLQVNDVSGLPLMAVNANGAMYMYSASLTGITASPTTAYSIDETTGTAAYFDYRVTNTVNNGWRAGTVMAVWNPTTNVVEFTDTSTADLTATTSGLSWSVSVTGTSVQLIATITSGTWNIKIGARVI